LDTKTGFWTKTEKLNSENQIIEKKLFENTKIYEKEFNPKFKIRLKNDFTKRSFVNNLLNNNGKVQFNGELKKVSKYKFSKISKFDQYQPELLITNQNNLIFFDEKGSLFNFSSDNKLIWKNNIYSKNERKQNPILYFASNDKLLVVADSISKYYAMNPKTGELLWSKNNIAPFNSHVKIFEDKFFVIDFENILRCYSIKDGKEIWNFKTEKSFIKSQQKLSFIVNSNKVVFINTLGDLSSIDIKTGNLIWQTPTQSSSIYENYFSLKNSDLISANNTIYFSNNKNDFFAIDEKNGLIKWKQTLNSNLRPTFADGLIFTVTLEGYLTVIDSRNGNIVRMTNVLNQIKNFKKKNIKPEGFILTNDKIYLSLNNGRLIIIEILTGKSIDVIKIDNEKISRPYILNNNMFIIKDNSILKLN
jgi:outer membrane protein assembly factor BamB